MAIFPSPGMWGMLARRAHIIKKLRECGAVSPQTARTLEEAGVINPHRGRRLVQIMVKRNAIHQTEDGKYYL